MTYRSPELLTFFGGADPLATLSLLLSICYPSSEATLYRPVYQPEAVICSWCNAHCGLEWSIFRMNNS